MKTYLPKVNEIDKKWYVIDAAGKPLGRVASKVASVLRGKHKVIYTPHLDTGDYVIVVNAEKVVLTGKKLEQKYYRHHSGYMGGLKEIVYKDFLQKKPELAMELAIKGMLPKNRLGRKMIKKLKIYRNAEHEHQAQQPVVMDIK
ncbi:MAG: 50S ribosomal protein L13 [Clostridiales bacterium GWE2_32_10]|nr:MAG: 50S ribosomal protein L13 [Clostridiales bacterium GWE2_32_10]HBY21052.1 50S ribosomal protein L13 [Clostridiales bacterium]